MPANPASSDHATNGTRKRSRSPAAAAAAPPAKQGGRGRGRGRRGGRGGRGAAAAAAAQPEELVKLGPEIPRDSEWLRTGWRPVRLSRTDKAGEIELDERQLAAASEAGYRTVGAGPWWMAMEGACLLPVGCSSALPAVHGIAGTAQLSCQAAMRGVPQRVRHACPPTLLPAPPPHVSLLSSRGRCRRFPPTQVRATHGAHSGTWYYEVRIDRLGPSGAARWAGHSEHCLACCCLP